MEAAIQINSSQFLTFLLDDELFAVDIGRVREVLEFSTVTKVPRVPDFMKGVINLRGSVVPVIDLRMKFQMGSAEQTVNTCVVIVEVESGGEQIVLGAMVDAVQEVFEIEAEAIEPPPRIGTQIDTEFIEGMGKKGEDFVIILDINKVFTTAEVLAVTGSMDSGE